MRITQMKAEFVIRYWILPAVFVILSVACAPTMKDIPKLQEKISSPDEATRITAVRDLGCMKNATMDVLPILYRTLKTDTSEKVRVQSVESLKKLGFVDSIEPLRTALKSDAAPTVRKASAEALHSLQGSLAYDQLAEAVNDESSFVRATCVRLIGEIGGAKALEVISQRLRSDPSPEVRSQAATSLGVMKDQKSFPDLKKSAMKDESSEVRTAAVIAIGSIPGNESLAFLQEALISKDMQDSAITALQKNQLGANSPEIMTSLLRIAKASSSLDSRILDIFLNSNDPRAKPYLYQAIIDTNVSRDTIDVIVKRLRENNDFTFVPRLINDMESTRDLEKTVRICQALGGFRDPRATPALMSCLRSSLNNLRSESLLSTHYIWALDAIGDLNAWDYLCELHCQDPDKDIRYKAGEALFHIYNVNLQHKTPASPCNCK
jgi:HEAT repeat protein